MFYVLFIVIISCMLVFAELDPLLLRVSLFIFLILIILVAGLRYQIGTDYVAYREIYINLSFDNFKFLEPGYRCVNLFFKYIGFSYEVSVFIFAIIINVLFYRFIRVYSVSVPVSLLLYICLNYYFIGFNAVRQMLSIAIFLNGLSYIWKRQYFQFLIIVLLASMFHYSIIVTVIYPLFKIKQKYVLLFAWIVSLVFIGIPIQNIIAKFISTSFPYAVYFSSSLFTDKSLLSILKLIIPNLFAALAFYRFNVFDNDHEIFWLNVFLFSVLMSNMVHGINVLIRFNYVFQISEIIFYPLFISKVLKRERFLVMYAFLSYCLFFYIATVLIQGAQGVVPYQSILFL